MSDDQAARDAARLWGWLVSLQGNEAESVAAIATALRERDERIAIRGDQGVHRALIEARMLTNSVVTDLRDLLERWARPCPESCEHAHCPVLRAVADILERRRTEIINGEREIERIAALEAENGIARSILIDALYEWGSYTPVGEKKCVSSLASSTLEDIFAFLGIEDRRWDAAELRAALGVR